MITSEFAMPKPSFERTPSRGGISEMREVAILARAEPEVYQFVMQTLENAFYPRPGGWIGGADEG